ncbi:Hypothetical protein SCLAV_0437 [Streptomyces clavuligerus]|uniref:Uncharacterized protein n=1 Tax=Streptomyces clavuligerus TaxID=1901 RepID=E2Q993_STRCL|nr:Hypothetical protein SCLAV_0437 [Streptomyces clavuligerus]
MLAVLATPRGDGHCWSACVAIRIGWQLP